HGLEVTVPDEHDRQVVHAIIYDELCRGEVRDASRQEVVRIIETLSTRGAQGVILGCTELPLLIGDDDVWVKVFDTTAIHAARAVQLALAQA
ncbi:MAG TPA: aspartate/glutamate racemase family protein, partial [Planctomycetota bacterium]|nr:aspartate/glutamate racemase family protein [Planctomycetota bacterium]